MKLILNPKLKYYTKEILKYFNIVIIGIGFIIAIILIKNKPIYKVTISGEEIGYVQNKKEFIAILIFYLINIIIAFYITNMLGIVNVVVLKSMSILYGEITWEVIIVMSLSLIESIIYEIKHNKKEQIG